MKGERAITSSDTFSLWYRDDGPLSESQVVWQTRFVHSLPSPQSADAVHCTQTPFVLSQMVLPFAPEAPAVETIDTFREMDLPMGGETVAVAVVRGGQVWHDVMSHETDGGWRDYRRSRMVQKQSGRWEACSTPAAEKAPEGPGENASDRFFQFLGRALCNPWFWTGVPLLAASFYSLLLLLSWEPISLVIPASALSYVVGTLGAKYILKEDVNGLRWAGVLLVCIGVAIVAAG